MGRWLQSPALAVLLAGVVAGSCRPAARSETGASGTSGAPQWSGPSMATPADPEPVWYLPVAGGRCKLFVQEFGTGPDTVVVLHGGFGAEHSYLLAPLSKLGSRYHLVFYDQRGSLRSPCPDSLVTLQGLVSDLEHLRKDLGVDRVNLLAHSMGTLLALAYLHAHPAHTGGLVLMGAVTPASRRIAFDSAQRDTLDEGLNAWIHRPACDSVIRENGLDRPDSLLGDKQRSDKWRIQFTCDNAYHAARWRAMKGGKVFYSPGAGEAADRSLPDSFDYRPDIRAHRGPVEVLIGDHDWVVGGPLEVRLYRAIPNTEVYVLPDASHVAWLDAPDAFQRDLREALRKAIGGVG